jgi:hypothetical protein
MCGANADVCFGPKADIASPALSKIKTPSRWLGVSMF